MPETGDEKCVVCDEAITNPICPECLQREVEHWLADANPSLIGKVRDYTGIYDAFGQESSTCIICGNSMAVCAHCFCKDVYEVIENELGNNAEDFLWGFNFELLPGAG